jgi:dihydrofolate reductase
MGQVVFKIHISIDGFVASPDGAIDWVFEHPDEEVRGWQVELIASAGVHAMGRNLYEHMAEFWPTATDAFAAPMNEIPKVVFSTTLEEAEWGPARIERRPPAEAIAALKAEEDGPILVHGGAGLARSLSREGLIDVYHLIVHPLALGAGLPIFDTRVDLEPGDSRRFPGGTVLHTYTAASS